MERKYLKAKNILYILFAEFCIIFMSPGGNSFMAGPNRIIGGLIFNFSGEAIFIVLCFSFKLLIDKKYRNALIFSVLGLINLSVVYYLVFWMKVSLSIVPFFHPITLALPVIFIAEKKFYLAIAGYLIGFLFSYLPLLSSVVPILFLQLWLDSLAIVDVEKRISRFLGRVMMNLIIAALIQIFIIGLSRRELLFPTASLSKLFEIAISWIAILTTYLIYHQYLKIYYEKYGNRFLRILSYIPGLWVIPAFAILFVESEKGANKRQMEPI